VSAPLSLKITHSGVRGIVGESLTPQIVTAFATAFGNYCGMGPVMLGTDTRPTAEMLKQAVIAGLLGSGCTPVDAGVVPVPALMLHIRESDAFGGICISASHNPIEWNALKFIGPEGVVLRPNQAAELTDLYHQGTFTRVAAADIAEARADFTTISKHRSAVLRAVDVEAIRSCRFRVFIDCCNGAAWQATPQLLEALGCQVLPMHVDPRSPFPHDPEPLPQNLGDLCGAISSSGADIGFAQDADADRLAIVDPGGKPAGEDCTIALAVHHWLQREPGPVVVNVSTSRMIEDIAERHGCPVHRTRVGEVHVVERMTECGAVIGGEGNGGVILPSVNLCRDSFVGIVLVLEAMAKSGKGISELLREIPRYAMLREKLACHSRDVAPSLRLLQRLFPDAALDLTDGVKAVWSDRWIHARPSNTEPVLRLIAEAPDEAGARSLMNQALECLSPSA
jgi:phosphomannomutase